MNVQGIVQEIEGDEVIVRYRDNADCGTCRACSHLFPKKSVTVRARNHRGIGLSRGDWVEVYLSPWKAVREGFLVLILPLLMFFPFYWIGTLVTGAGQAAARAASAGAGQAAGAAPAVPLLLGLAGIASGFALAALRRSRGRGAELPEIARTTEPPHRGRGCPH